MAESIKIHTENLGKFFGGRGKDGGRERNYVSGGQRCTGTYELRKVGGLIAWGEAPLGGVSCRGVFYAHAERVAWGSGAEIGCENGNDECGVHRG